MALDELLERDSGESAPPLEQQGGDREVLTGADTPSTSDSRPVSKVLFGVMVVGLIAVIGLAVAAGVSLLHARTELTQLRNGQQGLDAGLGAEVAAVEAQVADIQNDMARMRFAWDPQLVGQLSSLQQAANAFVCHEAGKGGDLDEAVAEFVTQESPRRPALAEVPGWDSQLDRSQLELSWQRCAGDGS